MGAQKVLLPWKGTTVIAAIVEELARARLDRIVVVTGHGAERVAEALAGLPAEAVENRSFEKGMLSSVRCGLRALPPECGAVLVALGDQPMLDAEVVARLLDVAEEEGKGIAVPVFRGGRGHPLAFRARYRDEILAGFDGEGLRGLLAAHPDEVSEVAVEERWVLGDIDTPEDYRREREGP
jgi:molybdenum cofactor cytidylyltransferase